jgi:hypothetical protein
LLFSDSATAINFHPHRNLILFFVTNSAHGHHRSNNSAIVYFSPRAQFNDDENLSIFKEGAGRSKNENEHHHKKSAKALGHSQFQIKTKDRQQRALKPLPYKSLK